MTITNPSARNDYVGNGAADTFPFTFRITDAAHLRVIVEDTDGNIDTLTLNADYTVTGVGLASGGSITLTAGPLEDGYKLTILSSIPITQLTDLRNRGSFFPSVLEDALDKLTLISQQQQDEINRAIKFPATDGVALKTVIPSAAARANQFLGFGAQGEPIAARPSEAPVSVFMQAVVSAASSSTAAAALGLASTTPGSEGAGLVGVRNDHYTGSLDGFLKRETAVGDALFTAEDAAEARTVLDVPSTTGDNTFTGDNRIKDTLVLYDPDDDTKGVMIDAGSVSSGQTRVITMGDADFNLRAATQAEQEAIVDNDVIVTPANQHSNPSAVKAWAHVMYSSGVPSLIRGYNIAGLVDVGTGVITVLWDVDFSDGNYVPGGIAQRAQDNAAINTCINGSTLDNQILPGSTTYRIHGNDGTPLDPLIFTAQASGDQVGP